MSTELSVRIRSMYGGHHHRGRYAFGFFLGVTWIIGLVGLDGGRASSFQLLVVGAAVALVSVLVRIHRRRSEHGRERIVVGGRVVPSNCIVITPLGQARQAVRRDEPGTKVL